MIVGIKGAQLIVSFSQEIFASRAEDVMLVMCDDNVTKLVTHQRDKKGADFTRRHRLAAFLNHTMDVMLSEGHYAWGLSNSGNPFYATRGATTKSIQNGDYKRQAHTLWPACVDYPHLYGACFGILLQSARVRTGLDPPASTPNLVEDLDRSILYYLQYGEVLTFPTVGVVKRKMAGGGGGLCRAFVSSVKAAPAYIFPDKKLNFKQVLEAYRIRKRS